MRAELRRVAVAAGVALAAAAAAVAAPAIARADASAAAGDTFWSKVAHPHRARYLELVAQAKLLLDTNHEVDATPVLREAVALEPREPLGLWLLGDALQRQGQWGGCADALGALVKVRADYTPPDTRGIEPVEMQLALCLSLASRVEEAVPRYQRVLAGKVTGEQRATIHWNLGDCYMVLGRLDEAIEQYALGVADNAHESMLRFALGVAYDRDEQVARSREQILSGLVIDPEGSRTTMRNVLYLPPQELHYYRGLIDHVASAGEGAGGDLLRRAVAIAHFRKYVSSLPDGPWVARAREHLAELGPAALAKGDIATPAEEPDKAALHKAILAAAPELQRCLEGAPGVAARAVVVPTFTKVKPTPPAASPAGKPGPRTSAPAPAPVPTPPATGTSSGRVIIKPALKPNPYWPASPARPAEAALKSGYGVTFLGPDEAAPAVKACVDEKLRSLKLTTQYATRVVFSFTALR